MNEKVLSPKNKLLYIFHMTDWEDYLVGDSDKAVRKTRGDKNFVCSRVGLKHYSWRVIWELEHSLGYM